MTQKSKAIAALDEYFERKGRVLNAQEYSRETDTPIRYRVLQQMFGTWGRVEKMIMAKREAPEAITDVDEVLAKRNEEAAAQENAWREASENQDKKAAREAQAQAVAEKIKGNAATAAGANANKIAIGGPLPGEQPKFEDKGTPVNIDPATGSREIVDPEPELVDANALAPDADGVGRTPIELKKLAAEGDLDAGNTGGSVATADDTSGGSQGSASISTVAAQPAAQGESAGDTRTTGSKPAKADDAKTSAKK